MYNDAQKSFSGLNDSSSKLKMKVLSILKMLGNFILFKIIYNLETIMIEFIIN